MARGGKMVKYGIYISRIAMGRDTATSEKDMQPQRKAGQHSRERGGDKGKRQKGRRKGKGKMLITTELPKSIQ